MTSSALATYETLAGVYDAFAEDYDHATWADRILEVAAGLGLVGDRLLDVGCGTGRSFAPFAARGWQVSACDLSPAMAACARAGAAPEMRRRVFAADMRRLPAVGPFDLVTCLDDAVNYLTEPGDVAAAFTSVARVLAPGGLFVFDANTVRTYRTAFMGAERWSAAGHAFAWEGLGAQPGSGDRYAARLSVVTPDGRSVEATHHQRHWTATELGRRLAAAGLETVAVLGQSTGIRLARHLEPDQHTKALFFARKGVAMTIRP